MTTFMLNAGRQHMIRLSAMRLSSSDSVRDLEVSQRGCLFPDEQPPGVPLRFYSEYSHPTCLFECALKIVAESENPWEAANFTKILETTNSSQCSHCLPDCEATTYTASTSSTPIRRCDSRNLNLNPFCSFDNTMGLAPWMDDVVRQYKDSGEVTVPGYVTNTSTGKKRFWFGYDNDAKQEMILQVNFFVD